MKKLLFILIFIVSNVLFAQNITFVYELKHKPKPEKDSVVKELYFLDVLGKQSVFRSEHDRRSDSIKEKTSFGLDKKTNFNQLYIFKNLINNKVTKNVTMPIMGSQFSIVIPDKLNWEIMPEKINIGEMEVQKAKISYSGRNWIAWFSSTVPIQEGPYVFYGLPGLIVKITDEKSDYDFTLISTKNSNKNNMFYLRKGKEITWDDYKKLQNNIYSDPFSEIKARGLKYQVTDTNGNNMDMGLKQLTEGMRKSIRENNNPIEIDYKVDFK